MTRMSEERRAASPMGIGARHSTYRFDAGVMPIGNAEPA